MVTERSTVWRGGIIIAVVALGAGAFACTRQQLPAADTDTPKTLIATGWIDATATLDPATTPIYAGDAPLKFEFLTYSPNLERTGNPAETGGTA